MAWASDRRAAALRREFIPTLFERRERVAEKKITRQSAGYKETAVYKRCADCSMFEEHGACTLVEGPIWRNGTCNYWEKDDRHR